MNIKLYTNTSERNRVTKNLENELLLTGYLRENCSVENPEIEFRLNLDARITSNYMFIEPFQRYYFINDLISISTGIYRAICHVDVLMSFAEAIKANRAILSKSENKWNLYLNDGTFKIYQNPDVLTKPFPTGFSTFEWVLAVAGSTASSGE